MIRILCDDETIYDPLAPEYAAGEPMLTLSANAAGGAALTLYPQNPRYSLPQKLKSNFAIYDDAELLFRGRLISETRGMYNARKLQIEGALAYLNDTIIRPFSFPEDFLEDPDYIAAAENGNVVAFFLGWILSQHNAQVADDRKLKLGNVTVEDPNNYITRGADDYKTAWTIAKDKLFGSALGGYLYARYESDATYVDYVSEFTLTAPQEVVFAQNLVDLTQDADANETYSVVLPLGAKADEEDGGARLTVSELPDGDVTSDIVKQGDQLYSRTAVAAYGRICAPTEDTTWDDVTLAQNLQSKAAAYLANTAAKQTQTIEVSAADLHFTDDEIRAFRPYQKVIVKSPPHGLSESYDLTSLTLNLAAPQDTRLTLGATQRTLTDQNVAGQRSTDQKIESVQKDVKGTAKDVSALSQRVTQQSTSIIQDAQQIIVQALADYVTTSDYETFRQTLETTLSVMAGQIELNFKTTTDQLNDLDGDVQRFFNEQQKYIRFVDGNIVLGEKGNEIALTIMHDRISFTQDNLEVAYFADHRLYITDAEFVNSVIVGSFSFQPAQNGSLSFRKVR